METTGSPGGATLQGGFDGPAAPVLPRGTRAVLAAASVILAIAASLGAFDGHAASAAACAAFAMLPGLAIERESGARGRALLSIVLAAIVTGTFATGVVPGTRPWQVPATWPELLHLTRGGGALLCASYLAFGLRAVFRRGEPASPFAHLAWLALPVAFNALLALSNAPLMASLVGSAVAGRMAILFAFNEAILLGVGRLMDRRGAPDPRLHAIMLGCSILVAATPPIADAAGAEILDHLPRALHAAVAVALAAASQCGLWAETFLVTGILLDSLRGRRPTWASCSSHARGGLLRGAIYAGVFMAIILGVALLLDLPGLAVAVRAHPVLAGVALGTPAYPLLKTLLESFDGSAPFVGRLEGAFKEPSNYLRGALAGGGIGCAFAANLPAAGSGTRFLAGAAIGAMAYAGADLLWNLGEVAAHRRDRVQSFRTYVLGAVLGGFVGGALAWYSDVAQLQTVVQKFHVYATLDFGAAGRASSPYVDYPLFSKYGAIDLGPVANGVKQLYAESLSGVINWSLAAPLFSVNLLVLTALFERSWKPVKNLFSATGFATLAEQTVRVLRWGLWMAPVIYTFLRLAPDPTWYNQDGLVRTIVASVQAITLSPADFRAWSLSLFLGILAYDVLRVLIWFDHMGLRVATLVNLSFVGGDALDEKAARFLGHAARTRVVPEGIRRFLTWAPLLIPFFIPRGADWDQVWNQAEAVGRSAGPLLPAVATLLLVYRALSIAAAAGLVALAGRSLRRRAGATATVAEAAPFVLGNGRYFVELHRDGRGYSRCTSDVRPGFDLDVTRRPDDPLQVRGKFVYLREIDAQGRPLGSPWSLTHEPLRGGAAAIRGLAPLRLALASAHDGVRASCVVEVAAGEPLETWTLTLSHDGDRARRFEIITVQELAVGPVDGYRRTPAFAAMHVGTSFVRGLGAILARNRLLKRSGGDPAAPHISREVGFHATDAGDTGPVRLAGYEDARPAFLGLGTYAAPAALSAAPRDLADEGLLYTFDPCASLRVHLELAPKGQATVRFADGYARDPQAAAERIARSLGRPPIVPAVLDAVLARSRTLHAAVPKSWTDPWSADGRSVHADADDARAWTHVIANPLGHGAVVSADGAVFAFAGNAQQNALTPPSLDAVPALLPGEAMLVLDRDTGIATSATLIQHRRADAQRDVLYGLGFARFHQQADSLDLTLDVYAAAETPAQFRRLRVRNTTDRPRRLRVLAYAQMVLAEVGSDSRGRLATRATGDTLLFAHPGNDFRKGWAFAASSLASPRLESVRARVVGAGRDAAMPYLLARGCADTTRADDGLRCAAFCGEVDLAPGAAADVVLVLGQVADAGEALALAARLRTPAAAEREWQAVDAFWRQRLDVLAIDTGDAAFDRLVNVWLPYQVLASRMWGRTGPMQRSGALGFRDQLQDVLPFALLDPALARRQIVLHAAQQFREGDVLKWWHDSWLGRTGIGMRTQASDPHLWLPYVALRYVQATGDATVLDEVIPFIEGGPVPRGQEGMMLAPRPARDEASVYEHCRRAIELALRSRGAHGLPLLGSGDWNDGLDAPGMQLRGESTWMAFFLHDVLRDFAPVAAIREGDAAAARYREEAKHLRAAAMMQWREAGGGYVRAIADDGRPLAYADALTSSWAVLSDAVELGRGVEGLDHGLAVLERDTRVLLMHPAFDEHSDPYPGRIAEYPPGVRENGGQYSHGVSWFVDAWLHCAELAEARGDATLADRARGRALEIWIKISPLSKGTPQESGRYGLPPHQQPADVYEGAGHAGRGGWSWYTGAAARMLSAAYALVGVSLRDGQLRVRPNAAKPLVALRYRGKPVPTS